MCKDVIKKQLRGIACDNCEHLKISIEERENYRKFWNEEMPDDWCSFKKEKPKENVCKKWEEEKTWDIISMEKSIKEFEKEFNLITSI